MKNLEKRIEALESQETDFPWVAIQNPDGSFDWNERVFPDKSSFHEALRVCGFSGRLLVIDI